MTVFTSFAALAVGLALNVTLVESASLAAAESTLIRKHAGSKLDRDSTLMRQAVVDADVSVSVKSDGVVKLGTYTHGGQEGVSSPTDAPTDAPTNASTVTDAPTDAPTDMPTHPPTESPIEPVGCEKCYECTVNTTRCICAGNTEFEGWYKKPDATTDGATRCAAACHEKSLNQTDLATCGRMWSDQACRCDTSANWCETPWVENGVWTDGTTNWQCNDIGTTFNRVPLKKTSLPAGHRHLKPSSVPVGHRHHAHHHHAHHDHSDARHQGDENELEFSMP